MNLLIIGNGLDLDLRLPTRYIDFLDFSNAFTSLISSSIESVDEFDTDIHSAIIKKYQSIYSPHLLKQHEDDKSVLERFDKCFSNKLINKACKDFYYCVHNNCWIKYFNERYEQNLISGENWIDLESEIQRIIDIFETKGYFEIVGDRHHKNMNPASKFIDDSLRIQELINEFYNNKITLFVADYKKFKENLLHDFDKFIMALGIYLDFFVGQLSPDVKHASKELIDMMTDNVPNKIDCVLSFNYKNNFMHKISLSKTCYIHGATNYVQELNDHIHEEMSDTDKTYMSIEAIIKRNKMIVGFDDLQENDENSTLKNYELEFIDYRKYFQRIYKGTDSQYVDWLNEYQSRLKKSISTTEAPVNWEDVYQKKLYAETSLNIPNHIFIFGHSLDATDNEIFKDIFLRELNDTQLRKLNDTQITIYYHDSDARKRIITNLVKILTQPILVQKTKGNNPNIKFVAQTYKE